MSGLTFAEHAGTNENLLRHRSYAALATISQEEEWSTWHCNILELLPVSLRFARNVIFS